MKRCGVALCIGLLLMSTGTVSAQNSSEEVIVTVDSTSLRFSPSEVTVTEGQTVRFYWSGQALRHNAVEDNGLFDSGDPENDVDYSYTFEQGSEGEYRFVCEPHEGLGMVGKVIVEAAEIIEPEEVDEEEEEEMPFISASSILMVLVFVALSRKSDDEDGYEYLESPSGSGTWFIRNLDSSDWEKWS